MKMRDLNKITFPVGMALIIGPRIVDKFVTPISKSICIVFALVGLTIVITGSAMSKNTKNE